MMNKTVVIIFVLLFFVSILLLIFPPAEFYSYTVHGKTIPVIVSLFLFLGSVITLIINSLEKKYPKEHEEAQRISYTPYAKYGWYALIFFLSLPFLLYGYILLSK